MSEKYDCVIIGAGVGGLVCGCYLAKAGMKTLIAEKNGKPGGCCVSFTRDGFSFDACAHSLGGLNKDRPVGRILSELNIEDKINLTRYDPSDIIAMPDRRFYFWNKLDKTIKGFQNEFPDEKKKIRLFFNFINNKSGVDLVRLKDVNFGDFLNRYFNDKKLKIILSTPVLVNSGTDAYSVTAFTAIKLYKQYMLDGGYYPAGGIEKLPSLLAGAFKELGGQLCLSKLITRIKVRENTAEGIYLDDRLVEAKYVISNIDCRQTFLNLIGESLLNKKFIKKINVLQPSDSMYILYLGLNRDFSNYLAEGTTHWFIDGYNIRGIFSGITSREKQKMDWHLMRLLPDKKSVMVFTGAPFKNARYWAINKGAWMEGLIKRIEQTLPGLTKHIAFKEAATPQTLYKYTLNYKGAKCGWANRFSQFAIPELAQAAGIRNLYLTGHWTTLALGIPGVACLGRDTANTILRKEGRA